MNAGWFCIGIFLIAATAAAAPQESRLKPYRDCVERSARIAFAQVSDPALSVERGFDACRTEEAAILRATGGNFPGWSMIKAQIKHNIMDRLR